MIQMDVGKRIQNSSKIPIISPLLHIQTDHFPPHYILHFPTLYLACSVGSTFTRRTNGYRNFPFNPVMDVLSLVTTLYSSFLFVLLLLLLLFLILISATL